MVARSGVSKGVIERSSEVYLLRKLRFSQEAREVRQEMSKLNQFQPTMEAHNMRLSEVGKQHFKHTTTTS